MAGFTGTTNFEKVLLNVENAPKLMQDDMAKIMNRVMEMVERKVRERAGLTDHSYEDLAEMGHPYSKRFDQDSGPHPDDYVHIQSGLLDESIEAVLRENPGLIETVVGVQESRVPYIKDLTFGNSTTRPRDFIGNTWLAVKEDVIKMIVAGIANHMRGGSP